MFEDYLIDCHFFFNEGLLKSEEREAKRYYRASVFYAASSIEAFSNYIADTFNKGNSLSPIEIAFLLDKKIVLDIDKIEIKEIIEYHRLEDKLRIFLKKFVTDFDFQCKEWSRFMEFKRFRDRLTHPKEIDDEISINDYKKNIRNGLSSIIFIMNSISKGVFKKPLRKKLIDLLP